MEATVQPVWMLAVEIATGIGLAACAGLRAFVPLLVVGAAGRLEWITLGERFEFLASTPALVVFGVALLVELLADKIPVVDHALDAIEGLLKPVVGAVLAASVLAELTPLQATVLGLVTGGTVSAAVHLGKAKLRLFSTVTSAGIANPVLSVVEDVSALVGSLMALIFPLLLLLLVVLTGAGILSFVARSRRGRGVRA